MICHAVTPSEAMAGAEGARSRARVAGALASSAPANDHIGGGFSFADDDANAGTDELLAARRAAAEDAFKRLRSEKRQAKKRSWAAERAELVVKFKAEIAQRRSTVSDSRLANNTNCITPLPSELSIPDFEIPTKGRDLLYFLRDCLRPLQRPRVADCGIKTVRAYDPATYDPALPTQDVTGPVAWISDGPSVQKGDTDTRPVVRAHYRGLGRCSNKHDCPVCMAAIRKKDGDQVEAEVARWRELHGGADSVLMLSLTVSHERGDSFRTMQIALSELWSALWRGDPAKRIKVKYGLREHCRVLDITHGKNGWHPHLHAYLFFDRPLSPSEAEELRVWLYPRWVSLVSKRLGAEFEPTEEYGVHLTPVHNPRYICTSAVEQSRKENAGAGMELAGGAFTKRAKNGNRTVMHIVEDYALYRHPEDALLWLEHCEAMEGARFLTWSQGLRLEEVSIEDTDEKAVGLRPLFAFPIDHWKLVRHVRGAQTAILKAIEWGRVGEVSDEQRKAAGLAKLAELVAYVLARRARDGSGTDPTRAERLLN